MNNLHIGVWNYMKCFPIWRKNIRLSLPSIVAFEWSQIGLFILALTNTVLSLSPEPVVGFLIGWREIIIKRQRR